MEATHVAFVPATGVGHKRKSTFTHVCRGSRYVAHMCPGSHCVGQMQTYSYFTSIGCEISFCILIALLKKFDAADDDDVDKCVTP